jgi:N-acetylmuramoyl-L-alanine amidase
MTKIFINPGHGLKANGVYDPGAVGPSGYQESANTKSIGALLLRKLEKYANVYLYQSGDLTPICNAANNWHADWFISIHCNGSVSPTASGIETYCYQFGGQGEALAKSVQTQLIKFLNRSNRGVKTGNFQVLRMTNMPAVLAEIGFISNPQEEALMQTTQWQEDAAEALAIGLSNHIGLGYVSLEIQQKNEREQIF